MTSLAWRLTLWFAAVVTATVAAVLGVGGWLLSRAVIHGVDALNAAEYEEIAHFLPERGDTIASDDRKELEAHTVIDAPLYFFQVHLAGGRVVFRSSNLGETVLPDLTGRGPNATDVLPSLGRLRISEFYRGNWHVQIASTLAPVEHILQDYLKVSAGLLVAAAIVSVGLGWGFSRVVLAPIRAIEHTARRISADSLGERIPVSAARDEISALAELLNQMFGRLQESFEQTRRFAADASHELKTPLALVRLGAEKLQLRVASDPESSALVAETLEEIERLNRIIEGLLFLARTEAGVVAITRREIAATDFMMSMIEDATVLAEDVGHQATLATNTAVTVLIEPTMVRQLLLNLVSNALHAMRSPGLLTLEATVAGNSWRVVVQDEGPGLPAAELEHIFERFVRLTPSAENAPKGHGLGLAIGRGIATLHGGSIRAENRADRSGLRVIVDLPVVVR